MLGEDLIHERELLRPVLVLWNPLFDEADELFVQICEHYAATAVLPDADAG
ncbi:hypothetical protein [Nocardia sp. NPDC059239]|uniref:hypothetical protein n=1 Tax=Nocardia sp. NPDC059239 TaxID=3346785 RepID=UPI0036CD65E1